MDSNENNMNNSLDGVMNMTPEEIDALFAQMQNQAENEEKDKDELELGGLFAENTTTGDIDIQEISKMLERADNNEAVDTDVLALMKSQEEEGKTAYEAMDLFSGEEPTKKKGFFVKLIEGIQQRSEVKKAQKRAKEEEKKAKDTEKKVEKEKKRVEEAEKKVKKKSENVKKSKKNSKKSDLVDYEKLDEDNNASSMDAALALLEGIPIVENDENTSSKAEIKEGKGKQNLEEEKPKKEKKKPKKKKEKLPKDKKQKDKKIKEKKVAKEKKVKEEKDIDEDVSGSWLDELPNKKKTSMIFAASIMFMLGFLVVSYYFTRHVNNQRAEEAYELGDYLECYQRLYNQKLDEEQAIIYHRSEITLKMNVFWNDYNTFMKDEQRLEGVDKLVQFVHEYPELSAYAATWSSLDIVEGNYQQVETILRDEYEITAQEAQKIASLISDEDYTRALLKLVQVRNEKFAWEELYPDMLPKEEERFGQKQ